jgi:hypothetical protein
MPHPISGGGCFFDFGFVLAWFGWFGFSVRKGGTQMETRHHGTASGHD